MTDEHPPESPRPGIPEEDGNREQIVAEALDDALAHASALATDLSDELGAVDDPNAPRRSIQRHNTNVTDPNSSSNLDAELADLQQLVDTTSHEISGEPDSAAGASKATEKNVRPTKTGFTGERVASTPNQNEPGSETAPRLFGSSSDPDTSKRQPSPGVVGTGLLGVVDPDKPRSEEGQAAESRADRPAGAQRGVSLSAPEAFKRSVQAAAARVTPFAAGLALLAVRLLERIDGPVGGVGSPVRRAVGWMALATLGTASIVYLVSLF